MKINEFLRKLWDSDTYIALVIRGSIASFTILGIISLFVEVVYKRSVYLPVILLFVAILWYILKKDKQDCG